MENKTLPKLLSTRKKATSFPEQAVFFYVKQMYKDAINSYKDIFKNRMELDVYIPSLKVGIEYDGMNWHKDEVLNKEQKKYKICKEHGISLFRLKEIEDHWDYSLENADYIIRVRKPFLGRKSDYRCLDYAIRDLIEKIDPEYLIKQIKRSFSFNISSSPLNFLPVSPINVDTKRDRILILEAYSATIAKHSLAEMYPEISKQWHQTKNGNLSPDMFTFGSGFVATWHCDTCNQDWEASIHNRTHLHRGCPYCSHEKPIIGVNDLPTLRPDLMEEWHLTLNKGIDPKALMPNSNKRVWWHCKKCGYDYQTFINSRNRGSGCPRCAGQVLIKGVNDLETVNPELAKEWDINKNGGLLPSDVFAKSNKKYFWICPKGHSYHASANNRHNGRNCPYCSGNKILVGFNDLATTHPEIAKEWHPTLNGDLTPFNVSKGHHGKIWFLCPKCNKAYQGDIPSKIKCFSKCIYCSGKIKNSSKLVLNIDTGKTYKTLKDAALDIGKDKIQNIAYCCNGKSKTAYGFHWKYIDK